MTTTTHLGMTLVEQSQAQKEVTVNAALVRIDALMNNGAKSRTTNTPPGFPASGDLYIVGSVPTGAWAGQANQMAYFDQAWKFIAPGTGMTLWVNDESKLYSYDGSGWTVFTGGGGGGGTPGGTSGQVQCNSAGSFGGFTVSGDATLNTSTGALTIASSVVSNSKMANMSANTVKMNNTGSSAAPTDATMAQLNAVLKSVLTVKTQAFTASGTYTPSTGMLYCFARCVGGGGGGGGAKASGGWGGGGGAGSYAEKMLSAATVGSSQTVTIGAAGSAGSTTGGNGGNGGDTSLGTLAVGKGGTGGTGVTTATNGSGGSGGIAGTGDVTIPGQAGGAGNGNNGGWSQFGQGGYGTVSLVAVSSGTGLAGNGYGAGGGGGYDGAGAGHGGGAGTAGYMVIIEYCSQ